MFFDFDSYSYYVRPGFTDARQRRLEELEFNMRRKSQLKRGK